MLSKKKKRSSQKFFRRSPQKNVFQKIFQALHKILTIQKIVLSSSRGQANFRGLAASRPRPRISKCVLEDVLEAKDVLEDSTSDYYVMFGNTEQAETTARVFAEAVNLQNWLILIKYHKCYKLKISLMTLRNKNNAVSQMHW